MARAGRGFVSRLTITSNPFKNVSYVRSITDQGMQMGSVMGGNQLGVFSDGSAPRNLSTYDTNWAQTSGDTGAGQIRTHPSGGVDAGSTARAGDHRTDVSAADTFAWATLLSPGGSSQNVVVWARVQNPTGSFNAYYLSVNAFAATWELGYITASSAHSITSGSGLGVFTGDSIGISAVGTTITAWFKSNGGSWSQLTQQTNGNVTGAGTVGLEITGDGTSPFVCSFGGGPWTPSDSVVAQKTNGIVDTGLSLSDTLSKIIPRTISDYGIGGAALTTLPSTILDTFTDGSAPRNLSAYNANWAQLQARAGAEAQTTGTAVKSTSGGGDYWTPINAADTFLSLRVPVAMTTNNIRIFVRIQDPTNAGGHWNSYEIIWIQSGGTYDMRKYVGAAELSLGGGSQVLAAGDSIGISIVGTTYTAWYKSGAGAWTALQSITDADVAGAGYVGFVVVDATATLDDFAAGVIPTMTDSIVASKTIGRVVSDVGLQMGTVGTPVLDDFNRADGADGANWTDNWNASLGNAVVSNQLAQNSGGFSGSSWTATFGSSAQVFADVPVIPTGGVLELALSDVASGNTPNGYNVAIGAGGGLTLRRVDAGTNTTLVFPTQSVSASDSVALVKYGSTIEVWWKASGGGGWQKVGSAVDATYSLTTSHAAVFFSNSTARIDNFGASIFYAPDSIAATKITGRVETDTGLSISDSVAMTATRLKSDTGLSVSDSITVTKVFPRTASDTGLSTSSSIAMTATRVKSDTGLSLTDTLLRTVVTRALTDTGLSNSSTLAVTAGRAQPTDTGLTVTSSISADPIRALTDTGLSLSSSVDVSAVVRQVADTGLAISSALAVTAIRAKSDTGLSLTDSLLRTVVTRAPADTGLNVSSSIVATAVRAKSDTGLSLSDSIVSFPTRVRAITDTGLSLTDAGMARVIVRVLSDQGVSITDSPVPTERRFATDSGLASFSDTLTRIAVVNTTSTGLSISESLVVNVLRSRTATDTGLSNSSSIAVTALRVRTASDTGLSITESIAVVAARFKADTGLSLSDSLLAVRLPFIADTGLTVSSSILRAISKAGPTDTGLTITSTLPTDPVRQLTDTGLGAMTDSIVAAVGRVPADTGLNLTASLVPNVTRAKTDTGLTVTDAVASLRLRSLVDTGLNLSDSLARPAVSLKQPADTGLAVSSTLTPTVIRPKADTGLSLTDTLGRTALVRSPADTGLNLSSSIAVTVARSMADTGLSLTESVFASSGTVLNDNGLILTEQLTRTAIHPRAVTDTGLSITEQLVPIQGRARTDTGLNLTDGGIVRVPIRALTDTVVIVDTLGAHHNVVATDTGLSISDSVRAATVRSPADTGLALSSTIAAATSRHATDTGLSLTDVVGTYLPRVAADTGLTVTDSIAPHATRAAADTGLTITDHPAILATRQLTDTGLSLADVLGAYVPRSTSSTGLTISDSIQVATRRPEPDTGLTITDQIGLAVTRPLTSTALTITDVVGAYLPRATADTGLSISDTIRPTLTHGVADQGLSVTDQLASTRTRHLTDTGLTLTDSVLLYRIITDTGLAFSDGGIKVHRTSGITDTGLVSSDTVHLELQRKLQDAGITLVDGGTALRMTRELIDAALVMDASAPAGGWSAELLDQTGGLELAAHGTTIRLVLPENTVELAP